MRDLTHSDAPMRVNDLFDPDFVCYTKQPGKRKHLGNELEKPSNIDTLYLDVMSPEFENFGTGVTQCHVNRPP
jgi:hypothetical protein